MAALNFPSNPTNGQQYTDPNGIVWQYISSKQVWNTLRSSALKDFSGAKVLLGTTEALTATPIAITWDSEVFDIGSYFTISDSSKFTISRPGFYRLNLLLITGIPGTGNSYNFTVKKNGTADITSTSAGANQSVSYDEIVELITGDYIELYASEVEGVGELILDSFFEIQNIGDLIGSAQSDATAFSGLKLHLGSEFNLTSVSSAIEWDDVSFNTNADINGNVYWNVDSSSKATIYTTGYYRIRGFFEAGSTGAENSYIVDLKFNNISATSGTIGPNDTLDIDDVYQLNSGSYLQFFASNTLSLGNLTTGSYFELIRLGV